MDLIADEQIPSTIILESPVTTPEQFYVSVVKPRDYEEDERVKKVFTQIFNQKKIAHFLKPESKVPNYATSFKNWQNYAARASASRTTSMRSTGSNKS